MRVTAVVLHHAFKEYLFRCLDSLEKVKSAGLDFDIVVVDNHTQDDSFPVVKSKYPKAKLLVNQTNLGDAEGRNVGIRYALNDNTDFVWLVSPLAIVEPNALLQLFQASQKYYDSGIFGSKILTFPQPEKPTFWYAGGNLDWSTTTAANRGLGEIDTGQYDRDLETDFVTGVSMLVRAQVFRDANVFDWRYFMFFDEIDFCLKARLHGWHLTYIWQSQVWYSASHANEYPASLSEYYLTRNQLLFGLRFAPPATKLSLLKKSVSLYLSGRPWQRRAVLDYYTRNFGSGSYQL